MLEKVFALEVAAAFRNAAIATAAGIPQTVADQVGGAIFEFDTAARALGYSTAEIDATIARHVDFDLDGLPAPKPIDHDNVVALRRR